ncbi:MAG: hypothetical protein ACRDKI_03760 [Solirubrobacterales bacterium]
MDRALQIAADCLRASLVLGALWYVSFSTWHKHMGYAMGLMALGAVLLRLAKAPPAFDFTFVALLSLDAWLTAWGVLANADQANDRPGHLLISAAVTPVLYFGAVRLRAVSGSADSRAQALAIGAVAAMLTVALGALWEIVEWQSDKLFGTDMSLGYSDTLGDLVCDVVGALAGGAIVAFTLMRARAQQPAVAEEPVPQALTFDAIHE